MSLSLISNIIVVVSCAQLNAQMNRRVGYQSFDVRGDGNCAFRAFAVAMNMNDDTQHAALRTIAMNTLQASMEDDERRAEFEDLLPDIIADPDFQRVGGRLVPLPEDQQNVNGYIARMRQNAVYAGMPEFRALAELYNVRVQVCTPHSSGNGFIRLQAANERGPGADARPWVYLLRVGAHYQALVRTDNPNYDAIARSRAYFSRGAPKTKSKRQLKAKSKSSRSGMSKTKSRSSRSFLGDRKTSSKMQEDFSRPVRRSAVYNMPIQRKQTVPIGNKIPISSLAPKAFSRTKWVYFKQPVKYNTIWSFPAYVEVELQHIAPKKGKQQFKIIGVRDEDYDSWIDWVLSGRDVERAFGLTFAERNPIFDLGEGVVYSKLDNSHVDAVLMEESSSSD